MRRSAHAPALVLVLLAALLACKPKHRVTGSIVVNGAEFVAKQCSIAEVKSSFSGGPTVTRSVTLVDDKNRRLSFSDNGGGTLLYAEGGGLPDNVGSGCGTIAFTGSSADLSAMTVAIHVDCRGGGVHTRAKASISGCGQFGL
ncbi:MAG: hypothetical protein KF718_13320 [Polyangiaceae bacterium]|nr:hypothetical protein [Polyangiaceae bacterium]